MFKKITKFVGIVLLSFVVGIFISQNTFSRVTVSGHSMDDTLYNGQQLWVNHLPFTSYNRGDVIVAYENGTFIVKRLIGLPGDVVVFDGDSLLVNGEVVQEPYVTDVNYNKGILNNKVTLGDDEYIVLGDNRDVSTDSRYFGAISRSNIKGKVVGYGS